MRRKYENLDLKNILDQRQGATEVHVFSLPRPHQEATSPDWAKFQSKYQQVVKELRSLRIELSQQTNVNITHQVVPQDKAAPKNTLLERVQKEPMADSSPALSQREVPVEAKQFTATAEATPGDTNATSSVNTRRAWRGML